LKDAQANQSKQAEESQKQQYDQAIKQMKTDIASIVDNNTNYETIKQTGMQDAVLELITQTFDAEGYVMDIEDAAKEVENHLLEEAVKLASLGKVQNRLKPPTVETPAPAPQPKSQPQPKPAMQTLTHKVTQQPTSKQSDKERRERAIAAFYGKSNN